ncbi:MAG: hypothetical protein Q9209_005623 [Squamulea sp. 1 TL-2023]
MPQPLRAVSYRPQTSRQAKRAYQKAGATPRISAVEQRRIDRAVELQERAARIRLHNVRARENKRKKAEKDEKERETRKRMGLPEPTKFKIGSSQLSLGAFVGTGAKQKKMGSVEFEEASCSSPYTPKEDTKAKEMIMECLDQATIPEIPECLKMETTEVSYKALDLCCTSQNKASPQRLLCSQKTETKSNVTSASLMPPPPRRVASATSAVRGASNLCPQPYNDTVTIGAGTDWDMFLDSNTQVEREISFNHTKPSMQATYQQSTADTSIKLSVTPTDILADISTQDLQYHSSPPQIPDVNVDKDAEFLGGIQDKDLSDLDVATFLECCEETGAISVSRAPSSQRQCSLITPYEQIWPSALNGDRHICPRSCGQSSGIGGVATSTDIAALDTMDEFDDYGFSSQELRQLVV